MRSDQKIFISCDGVECNRVTEVDASSYQSAHPHIDKELERRGWTYYGNLDFCQKCKEEKNHEVLKEREMKLETLPSLKI